MRNILVLSVISVVCQHGICCFGQGTKQQPIVVRVLVLNFDPLVPEQNVRLHQVCKWNSPKELADGYIADVNESSRGFIQYRIAQWQDLDEFPVKADGFRYSVQSYLECRDGKSKWHEPDLADYPQLLEHYGALAKVNAAQIDEVWLFGGPYFGFHESSMVGPNAFYINGGIYDKVEVTRRFAVMGYNYERGAAEMLHNLSHRTEASMSRVFGGWKSDELTSDWARFAANLKQSGTAAVGSCHYPPNGEKNYDYANPRFVDSSADDWLKYPELSGATSRVSCETWGGPDYHRNYMKWWFKHLPHMPGQNKQNGKRNNWWKYVFELSSG